MGPGFQAQQVMAHWRIMQPGRITGKWEPEEDELLQKVGPTQAWPAPAYLALLLRGVRHARLRPHCPMALMHIASVQGLRCRSHLEQCCFRQAALLAV